MASTRWRVRKLCQTSHPTALPVAPTKSSLHRLPYDSLSLVPVILLITPRHGPHRKHRLLLYSNRFSVNMFVCKGINSVTAMYTCLLRICCLAADVVLLFVSRSLPSNGSTCYIIFMVSLLLIVTEKCVIESFSVSFILAIYRSLFLSLFTQII
jgi:hypothetical protein